MTSSSATGPPLSLLVLRALKKVLDCDDGDAVGIATCTSQLFFDLRPLPTFAIRDADWMDTLGQSLGYSRLQGLSHSF